MPEPTSHCVPPAANEVDGARTAPPDVDMDIGNVDEIEQSEALAFWLSHRHCVIVGRDGPQRLQSADPAKRIRDLRPGDAVLWQEKPREVLAVSVYR